MEYNDGSMTTADFASSAKFRELTQQDLERAFAEVYKHDMVAAATSSSRR